MLIKFYQWEYFSEAGGNSKKTVILFWPYIAFTVEHVSFVYVEHQFSWILMLSRDKKSYVHRSNLFDNHIGWTIVQKYTYPVHYLVDQIHEN